MPVIEEMETDESRRMRRQSLIEEYKIRQKARKGGKKRNGGENGDGERTNGRGKGDGKGKKGGKKRDGRGKGLIRPKCNCCKDCPCACKGPARLIASPLYEDILCFNKNSKHAQELISKGVHAMTLEEANFDIGCQARVNRIKYSASEDEYQKNVDEYHAFTSEYSKRFPHAEFPEAPHWRGEGHRH